MARWTAVVALLLGLGNAPSLRAVDCHTTATNFSRPALAASKTYYVHVPEVQIRPWRKLNPVFWFGNIDDPIPPPSYRPNDKHRNWKWGWRNPCHNFMFYVIGISDREFIRTGRYPSQVFNPDQGWNWTVCRYRCWRLPFVSYQKRRFSFYCGWRNRGNFGIKLRFTHQDGKKAEAQPSDGRTVGPSDRSEDSARRLRLMSPRARSAAGLSYSAGRRR